MTGKPTRNQDRPTAGTLPRGAAAPAALQLLRAMDAGMDTVLLADAGGAILYANPIVLERCGYEEDELIGRPMSALWFQPNALTQTIMADLAAKRSWRGYIQHKTKESGFFLERVTISPVTDENGAVTHLIKTGVIEDTRQEISAQPRQNDATYENILDLMGDGYIECNLRGDIIFVNKSAARTYQRRQEEMIGLSYRAYTTPDEAERLFQVFSEIYQNSRSDQMVAYQVVRPDGTLIACETRITLLRDHHGDPVGFGGVTRDVSEKERLTAQLKESEESYRRVLELAPDAITISRVSDGRYFEVNETFCQQTGYAHHEVIGRTVIDMNLYAHPEDRKRIVHALRTKGRVSGMRVTFVHRDGSLLHDIVSARIIQFKGEECILFVATLINPLVEAQNALQESEEKFRMILSAATNWRRSSGSA